MQWVTGWEATDGQPKSVTGWVRSCAKDSLAENLRLRRQVSASQDHKIVIFPLAEQDPVPTSHQLICGSERSGARYQGAISDCMVYINTQRCSTTPEHGR